MSLVKCDLDLAFKVTGLFIVKPCRSNISGRNVDMTFIFIPQVHLVKIVDVPCQMWPWPSFEGHMAIYSKRTEVIYLKQKCRYGFDIHITGASSKELRLRYGVIPCFMWPLVASWLWNTLFIYLAMTSPQMLSWSTSTFTISSCKLTSTKAGSLT